MATLASKKEVSVEKAPAVKKAVAKKDVAVAKKAVPAKAAAAPAQALLKVAANKPVAKSLVKSPVKPAVKPANAKAAADTLEKAKKSKLVRDSFTMPEAEYAVLGQVKKACLKAGVEVKKSQLLRIGLVLLNKTDVPNLKKLIAGLAPLKAGRPKKDKP